MGMQILPTEPNEYPLGVVYMLNATNIYNY